MIRENLGSGDKCFPQAANKRKDYSILRCLLSRRLGIHFPNYIQHRSALIRHRGFAARFCMN